MRPACDRRAAVLFLFFPRAGRVSTVQWETRQASFPTGTVGPRVGIFLEPMNTNDGFFFSYTTSSDRTVRYSIISVGDVTEVDVYSQ